MSDQGPEVLEYLRALLSRLQTEEDALRARCEALKIKREAVETTLRLALADADSSHGVLDNDPPTQLKETITSYETPPKMNEGRLDQQVFPSLKMNEWAKQLRGLTHIQALVRIAQLSDGVVRVSNAKDILISVGLAKGKPANVRSSIHHILADSDLFERVAPGAFGLRAATPVEVAIENGNMDGWKETV